jgi:hypothetical protein
MGTAVQKGLRGDELADWRAANNCVYLIIAEQLVAADAHVSVAFGRQVLGTQVAARAPQSTARPLSQPSTNRRACLLLCRS